MQIKTADGNYNVASNGVGVGGLTTGIIGTAGWVLSGGLNNLLNGRNSNGFSESSDTREISALRAELAKEKAERYADAIGIASFKEAIAADEKILNRVAVLENFAHETDKKNAVLEAVLFEKLNCMNGRITTLEGLTKVVIPDTSICPPPTTTTTT